MKRGLKPIAVFPFAVMEGGVGIPALMKRAETLAGTKDKKEIHGVRIPVSISGD